MRVTLKGEVDRTYRLETSSDLETWLPDDILAKVDRASMAHSLEVRVPIVDHLMVEFATSLPAGLLIRGGSGKVSSIYSMMIVDSVTGRPS